MEEDEQQVVIETRTQSITNQSIGKRCRALLSRLVRVGITAVLLLMTAF
jgi:hypothetical protein